MKPETKLKLIAGQSGKKDKNKTIRNKRLEIRMSPEEFELFEKKFLTSEWNSMASFARNSVIGSELQAQKNEQELMKEVRKFSLALNKIGTNVNQISRNLNTKKNQILSVGMTEDLEIIRDYLKNINNYIMKLRTKS